MTLYLVAFLSGVLTVLAPCVLPLLPVILGASAENTKSKRIPLIVIASLSISIILFSLVLKATTLLIDIHPDFWKYVSGGLVFGLGVITLFPGIWKKLSAKLGLGSGSQKILQKTTQKEEGTTKYILLGAALGPVFSSCSPTYALILAIILPAGFIFGLGALIAYVLGLAVVLFAIALLGQKLVKKLKWVSKPGGTFQKILGIIFIIVGLAILSGFDKKIETKLIDIGFLGATNFEQRIINELDLDEIESSEDTTLGFSLGDNRIDIGEKDQYTCSEGRCEKKDTPLKIGSMVGEKAPEFIGLQNWINSEPITSLGELEGKVVMIDFWTLGCINCINTHEETNKLYSEFKDKGLVVIGIHAPEFSYEQNIEQVQQAVEKYNITFPVVQDNDFLTWRAYNNRYWPAFYIIDQQGIVRHTHFGEGGYQEKREKILNLLNI